jgi:anaerobic selenocysteine-containing dehydrogenase
MSASQRPRSAGSRDPAGVRARDGRSIRRHFERNAVSGHEVKTFCSLCAGSCGLKISFDDAGAIVGIRGDDSNPLTAGYACIKGLQLPQAHASPERLLRPLRREADGRFVPIPLEQALDEIAAKLSEILARDGPDAIAAFRGTLSYSNYMLPSWVRAIGSHGFYSTMTIDQSAKWVCFERLGGWAGGREPFAEADVMLLVGANPLVSLSTFNFVNQHPVDSMRAARARGMQLIVIDPRRTETARHADVHLQPLPGEDATLLAGLLRIILSETWYDRDFCSRHVNGLESLRHAVDPFTPGYVAARAGVDEALLRQAAHLFACPVDGRRGKGSAASGVGPSMAPHANLSEHLLECLNVVCGRYARAGDAVANPGVIGPRQPRRAQAISPRRSWERGYRSAVGDYGTLFGEKMSGALCDEILSEGSGRVRALIVDSGNPVNAIPGQRKVVRAMRALDLLVVIDPFLTNTGRLAHYVLPPLMLLERPALPPRDYETIIFQAPYTQYAPAVLAPPAGAELVDPNHVFWALARRMGRPIVYDGVALDMERAPSTDELLAILARHGQVPFDEIRGHDGGRIYAVAPQVVEDADPATAGRFEVMPPDVAQELRQVLTQTPGEPSDFTHRLCGRRMRDVQNTMYRHLPVIHKRHPFNPAYLNPGDLAALGVAEGAVVRVVSPHGSVRAVAAADPALRSGVVSMSHGWGELPGDEANDPLQGASTNLLTTTDAGLDPINAMPVMNAIAVRIEADQPAPRPPSDATDIRPRRPMPAAGR